MGQSNEAKVQAAEALIASAIKTEPKPESRPEPEPEPEPEQPKPVIESKTAEEGTFEGKIKKKRKKARASPYNVFKKRMMNSEEIKSIPSKKRFAWVAQQWKKEKEKKS